MDVVRVSIRFDNLTEDVLSQFIPSLPVLSYRLLSGKLLMELVMEIDDLPLFVKDSSPTQQDLDDMKKDGVQGEFRIERGWLNPNDDFQMDDLIELVEIGK